MKERIKKVRKDASLNQSEFGAILGVSRDAIATYESGRVVPDAAKRMLICEKFHVNPEWLENGGDLDPYKTGLIPRLSNVLRNAPAIKAALEQLVDRLTLEDWQALNAVVEKATKKEE